MSTSRREVPTDLCQSADGRFRCLGCTVTMEPLKRSSNSIDYLTTAGGPSGFFGLVCGFGNFTKRKSHGERSNFDPETVGAVFHVGGPEMMDENLRMFVYMVRHDPAVVAGLGLIGVAGALWFHVLLQLERVGLGSYAVFKFGRQLGCSSGVSQGTREIRLACLACLSYLDMRCGRGGLPCCWCVSA
jgi:hypothetical protein